MYTCRFSITLTLITVEVAARYVDASQLSCISPSFNVVSRSRSAEFSLKAEGGIILGPLDPTLVYFSSSVWFAAQPLIYSSAGGGNITIQGARFNPTTAPYRLKFHSVTNEVEDLFSECRITSSESLLCKSPSWRWESGPAHDIALEISLLDSFSVVGQTRGPTNFVLLGVGEWNYFELQYLPPWSEYSSVCQRNQIIVYGQFKNGSNIQCKFNFSSGIIYTNANVTQFQATCPLSVNPSVSDVSMSFSLVDSFGVQIPYISVDSADNRLNVTAACWNADINPSRGPSVGASVLLLTGTGFCSLGQSCPNAFVCQFQAETNSSMIAYSPVSIRSARFQKRNFLAQFWPGGHKQRSTLETTASQIVNSSLILCATPAWPFPAAKTRVLLIDVGGGLDAGRPVGIKNGMVPYNSPALPYFIFQSTIVGLSHTNIPASGLAMLTVYGSAFDQKNTTCSYQFDQHRILLPAKNVSFSEIRCPAPPWPGAADGTIKSKAVLTVLQGSPDSPTYRSNQYNLNYVPYVFGFSSCTSNPPCNTTSGYAGIEFNVQILVRGFDSALTSSSFLYFTGPSGQVLSSNLFAVSDAEHTTDFLVLQANLSEWPFESAKTRITVVAGSYTLTPNFSVFYFRQLGLDLVDKMLPATDKVHCPLGICWPLVITLTGSGFIKNPLSKSVQVGSKSIVNESDYNCKLRGEEDNTKAVVIRIVTVDSPSQVRCIGDFSGSKDYYSQHYSINLQYSGDDVAWLGYRLPIFFLSPVFIGLECGALCFGKTIGSDTVNIFGYGYNQNFDMSCIFASEAFEVQSVRSQASVVSTSQVRCSSPSWPYGEGPVLVQIVMNNGSRVRESLSTPPVFRYQAVWWLEKIFTLNKGEDGIELLVHGLGFVPGDNYLLSTICTDFLGRQFVVNASQHVPAMSYSNITLLTPSSLVLGSEGNVSIQLFRCSFAEDCKSVAADMRPMHFTDFRLRGAISDVNVSYLGVLDFPTSCLTGIICWAPAGGFGALELTATGLHYLGINYHCNFNNGTHFEVVLGSISDSGNLLCATPSWPSCPARLTLTVWSEISGILPVPTNFELLISPVVQSLYPTRGPISGGSITVSGMGFVGMTLSCRLSGWYTVDTGGFSQIFLQAHVPAKILSNTDLICNTSGAWSGYPATVTSLVVVLEDSAIVLSAVMASNATMMSVSSMSHLSLGKLLFGTYVAIENETILLTKSTCIGSSNTNCVFDVQRGVLDSVPAFHSTASVIRPLIPLQAGKDGLDYEFDAVIISLNVSEARVDGGVVLGVKALGLKSTYLAVFRVVQNSSCNPTSLTSITPPTTSSASPLLWGLAFDVSAKYDLQIQSLDFFPAVLGIQKVWVMHRKRSTCGSSKMCSSLGHSLVFSDWEYLVSSDGFQVNAISIDPIPLAINFTLKMGERHGFLMIAQNGLQVGLSDVESGMNPSSNSNQSYLRDCNLYRQDSSLEIHSGQLVLSSISRKSKEPFSFVQAFDNQSKSYVYQGSLKYLRQTIRGPVYTCKFVSLTRSGIGVESTPSQAMSSQADPTAIQATNIACIIPPWQYGESVTSFTLSSSEGTDIGTDSTGKHILFKMSAAVSAILGAFQGSASGGDALIFVGAGLGSPGFLCQFTSLEYSDQAQSTFAIPLNDTHAECTTPNWKFAASKVLVEFGSFRPEISLTFTAVRNLNSTTVREVFWYYEVCENLFPNEGLGLTNDLITVLGAGFDHSKQYVLLFYDKLGHTVNTSSHPSNSSVMIFNSPQWGSNFASATTTVRMFRVPSSGQNMIEISGGNKTFTFQAFWSVDQFYFNQTLGCLIVKLKGGGFNTSSTYVLRFASGSRDTVLFSIIVTATSTSQIEAVLQDWKLDGLLKITLLDGRRQPICNSMILPCFSYDFNVALNETCLSVQPSLASAQGGQVLTVKGAGFSDQSPLRQYACIFVFSENRSRTITVNSTFLDVSHIICNAPRFMLAGSYLVQIAHAGSIVPFNNLSDGFPFYVFEVFLNEPIH